jgi:hypothetical protein
MVARLSRFAEMSMQAADTVSSNGGGRDVCDTLC